MPKSEKEVMDQMKKGLYNASEDRNIQTSDKGADLYTGAGSTPSKTQNRKS